MCIILSILIILMGSFSMENIFLYAIHEGNDTIAFQVDFSSLS